jgi:hypothetical protein
VVRDSNGLSGILKASIILVLGGTFSGMAGAITWNRITILNHRDTFAHAGQAEATANMKSAIESWTLATKSLADTVNLINIELVRVQASLESERRYSQQRGRPPD